MAKKKMTEQEALDKETLGETVARYTHNVTIERQLRDPLFGARNFFNFPLRGKLVAIGSTAMGFVGVYYFGTSIAGYLPEVLPEVVNMMVGYGTAFVSSFAATHAVLLTPLIYERGQTRLAIKATTENIRKQIELSQSPELQKQLEQELGDILSHNTKPQLLKIQLGQLNRMCERIEEGKLASSTPMIENRGEIVEEEKTNPEWLNNILEKGRNTPITAETLKTHTKQRDGMCKIT